ncbi:hypothetical protein H6P81_009314 [Aristolochia fimbriata]|uniref:Cystatin domain-containing protein n=1 Tax=Aristolochia fimbriata TaxID=158543 RepID=A0AAV7ELS7_ARIFI|nr:hypothetical protein H6P81_009314 [Aristolochia fimbriata]
MRAPPILFLLLLLAVLLAAATAEGGGNRRALGEEEWGYLDPTDPKGYRLARFAIREHNTEDKDSLVFNNQVWEFYRHVVDPTRYRIFFEAGYAGWPPRKYEAIVWEREIRHLFYLAPSDRP